MGACWVTPSANIKEPPTEEDASEKKLKRSNKSQGSERAENPFKRPTPLPNPQETDANGLSRTDSREEAMSMATAAKIFNTSAQSNMTDDDRRTVTNYNYTRKSDNSNPDDSSMSNALQASNNLSENPEVVSFRPNTIMNKPVNNSDYNMSFGYGTSSNTGNNASFSDSVTVSQTRDQPDKDDSTYEYVSK